MINSKFGKRSYVSAAYSETEDDPGGGGRRSNLAAQARSEGTDLQREAARKKFFFQQKMELEGSRKKLGQGNIVTYLLADAKQGIELSLVNKMLRVSGFSAEQVLALKINDFRSNQIEVLFKDEVQIDIQKVEEKIRNEGIDASVSKFSHTEEYIMIYGLPPTTEVEYLREKNQGSSRTFCKKAYFSSSKCTSGCH